jgi:hypothetical protein
MNRAMSTELEAALATMSAEALRDLGQRELVDEVLGADVAECAAQCVVPRTCSSVMRVPA